MTIERFGSTEGLKDVFGAKVLPIISLVVVHNGIVSTCGITAEPTGDVKVQTRKVLASIDGLLEKAGTDKSKLLTAQVWLADMQDFEEHNSVWNEWVDRKNPPVRACVQTDLATASTHSLCCAGRRTVARSRTLALHPRPLLFTGESSQSCFSWKVRGRIATHFSS
jgi:enamine deaminase RidA (YjgF/YER057c/UK114 family)